MLFNTTAIDNRALCMMSPSFLTIFLFAVYQWCQKSEKVTLVYIRAMGKCFKFAPSSKGSEHLNPLGQLYSVTTCDPQ